MRWDKLVEAHCTFCGERNIIKADSEPRATFAPQGFVKMRVGSRPELKPFVNSVLMGRRLS